jgi:hypothetical protein
VFESSHSDINPLTAIDSAAYVLKTEEEVNGDHGHPKEVLFILWRVFFWLIAMLLFCLVL